MASSAYDLFMSGEKQVAIDMWQENSSNGDIDSKYVLGILYNDSQPMGLCEIEDFCINNSYSNYKKAKNIFEELFKEHEDPRAAYALGEYYDDHWIFRRNYTKAAKYYLFAAERGVPEAQYNIGSMYERGDGIKKDIILAVRWYLQCNKSSLCGAGELGIEDLIVTLSKEEFLLAKSQLIEGLKEIDIRITTVR